MEPQGLPNDSFSTKSHPFQQSTGQQLCAGKGAGGRGEALIHPPWFTRVMGVLEYIGLFCHVILTL